MAVKLSTASVAEVAESMANELEIKAQDLRRLAKLANETGDPSYAAEVAAIVMNIMGSLRLDLLVGRPIREMECQLNRLQK